MGAASSKRWWALVALVPVVLAVNIDATILSLALPTLASALKASTADLQWFVAAYTLVFAAAMVPGGVIGDRWGRKRVLLVALAVFGAGSVACAAAGSPSAFIAARVLLGLGAGVIVPMALGVLPALFDDQDRGKAIAAVMTATMLGYPLGPILGGWLLSSYSWRWVFLINVPVVVLGLLTIALLLPESRGGERRGLDPVGLASASGGLAVLSYGVIRAGQSGWGDGIAVGAMLAGVLVLGAFVTWERRQREPLVDLGLFRVSRFTSGTGLVTAVSFALFGIFFAAPLLFQEVYGLDALGAGVRLLPMIGGLIVTAGVADLFAKRAGGNVAGATGFVIVAVGLLVGATTGPDSGYGFVALWLVLIGLGTGLVMPTTMDAALGALSREASGTGSGLIQSIRMVGATFGAAILGSLLNSTYRSSVDPTSAPAPAVDAARKSVVAGVSVADRLGSPGLLRSVRGAFVHGMDVLLATGGGIAVVCVVLAFLFLPRRAAAGAKSERQPAGELAL